MRKAWFLVALVAGFALLLLSCAGPQGSVGPAGPGGPGPSAEQVSQAVAKYLAGPEATSASVARGGQIYDKWWKVLQGATEPKGDHSLWALQTTNKRTGLDTWRCKECHGWDYKGKGGAYSKGSHYTGFPGVYDAATTKTATQLTEVMKGGTDYRHDFSKLLGEQGVADVVAFLKQGVINEAPIIDYAKKKPIGANAAHGAQLYSGVCAACHGADGKQINFGSATEPEYVGSVAIDNPWEFLNKVRFGQPGAPMPAGVVNGWSVQDVLDVLAHAQTLPE